MPVRTAKPSWLKTRLTINPDYARIHALVRELNLHTVCQEARCPNHHECWALHRTATFMILGRVCTRSCRFCAVESGRAPGPVDPDEPGNVARAAARMELRHVVVTSVTRDDLPDGGAAHYARTVAALREGCPGCRVEVLPSDLGGDRASLETLVRARPDVFNHNLETVARLTPVIRSGARYGRSVELLARAKEIDPGLRTKSGLMLGLGETREEVLEAMADLRRAGVDLLTLGQYLQPTPAHLPVDRYWHPDEFAALEQEALALGFAHCQAGPLVRSSYQAGAQLDKQKDI